jgi:ORF6N domain
MTKNTKKVIEKSIESRILTVRDQKVILDADLADIYGVTTKRLNEQVRRNEARFPGDFSFQVTQKEVMNLKSQFATSSGENLSQFVSSSLHGGRRKLPTAFTEHGAIMASSVLNSSKAIEMSVFIVRAFVKMREQLLATATLAKRLAEVEKLLLVHDSALRDLYQKIQPLLMPPEEPEQKRIGFDVRESRAKYRTKKPKNKKAQGQ